LPFQRPFALADASQVSAAFRHCSSSFAEPGLPFDASDRPHSALDKVPPTAAYFRTQYNPDFQLEKIFTVIKQMEADGVIGRYAIGGAVGSIFWLEPITTKDVDVFVMLPTTPGGLLLTLGPIYEYLMARGYMPNEQFVVIEGWAVEFLPPGTPLVEEALEQAVERDVNGVGTRVFTAEHLAAICLQVGRAKDHDRLMRFIEAGVLDAEVFEAILIRHGLTDKWAAFQTSYLES
jgi:hypothetical protein